MFLSIHYVCIYCSSLLHICSLLIRSFCYGLHLIIEVPFASVSLLLLRFVCPSMFRCPLLVYILLCLLLSTLICYRWVNGPIFGWWRSSEQGLASGGKLLYSLKGKKQVTLLLWGLLFILHLSCFIRKGVGDLTAKTKTRNRRKSYFEEKWKSFAF